MHIKYCHLVSLSHKDWTHLENTNSDATPATKNNNFILINCLLIISLMVCDYQFMLGFVFLASKLGRPTHNAPHPVKQRDSGKREKKKGKNSLLKSPHTQYNAPCSKSTWNPTTSKYLRLVIIVVSITQLVD